LIALTGGPGAGKTAVLELARRSLGAHVALLPEAASIIFGGGFWRRSSLAGRKACQRAIFHVQREQERLVLEEGLVTAALCDRGTLDGLAYWPENEASFWRELSSSRQAELLRYHAVIHLRTPSAEQGYNHDNPLRTEDAATAHAIDERIASAWEGHPNRIVIGSSADFLSKAQLAIEYIKATLPDCDPRQLPPDSRPPAL
jgi:predicted ATPase